MVKIIRLVLAFSIGQLALSAIAQQSPDKSKLIAATNPKMVWLYTIWENYKHGGLIGDITASSPFIPGAFMCSDVQSVEFMNHAYAQEVENQLRMRLVPNTAPQNPNINIDRLAQRVGCAFLPVNTPVSRDPKYTDGLVSFAFYEGKILHGVVFSVAWKKDMSSSPRLFCKAQNAYYPDVTLESCGYNWKVIAPEGTTESAILGKKSRSEPVVSPSVNTVPPPGSAPGY